MQYSFKQLLLAILVLQLPGAMYANNTYEGKIMNIQFEKAQPHDQKIIFEWLTEPHVQEFWDNSQEHKDDIVSFINGRKTTSNYFHRTFIYWIGSIDNQPFCFILSDEIRPEQNDLSELHRAHLSKTGTTIGIDFCIGNKAFLGKGLAAPTLRQFTEFYHANIDQTADTFFIDPDENNPRAKHVYQKAGFEPVGSFVMEKGVFKDKNTDLLVKKL